jgi:hypothetical protein
VIKVGKLDKQGDYLKDFEIAKEFFLQFFKRAILKNVSVRFPVDFIVSPKIDYGDTFASLND